MPRRERPLEPSEGPLRDFAAGLRKLRQKAGNPPYRRLAEQAHYAVSTLSSAASGQRLPTLAVTLAYVRACEGDEQEWERRWREVAGHLQVGEFHPDADEEAAAPPYAGLRWFREQDAEWYFGREQLVDELAERLERRRFVVAIGASGSGKSSLLRAGLVPRLRAAGTATAVVLTPGPRPLEECAVRLGALAGVSPGSLYGELSQAPENLGRLLRQIAARSGTADRLLLVVDQFEEAFTLCQDDAERDAFVEALITAASDGTGRCRVALGVRADFYAHCTHNPLLLEAMRDAQVPVGPMRLSELRRAITKPAQRAGLTVEGALLATLTAQAHGQAGVLPLLSHALLQTWRRRRGNALTLEAFERTGGLEGGLARTAEDFYQRLNAEQKKLARWVFVRLTALGEGTEDTRRPARAEELTGLAGADDADMDALLDGAASARLIVLDRDRVDLAHEALIRCWPRLHGWLTEDREAVRTTRQLTEAAHAWEALGRDPGALYRGTRLDMASRLTRTSLFGLEREFLDAGLAARSADRSAARRRTRLRHLTVALLSVLLLLTTTTAVFAERAQRSADRQRDVASSQRVAEKAAALRSANPALAAQLSLAAYRLSPTPEARGSLLSTFATPYAAQLPGRPGALSAAAYSADGRLLVTAGSDGTVRLWRTAASHRPRELTALPRSAGPAPALAVSPDGRHVAAGGEDGTVTLWDAGDARKPRSPGRLKTGAGPVVGLGFGPGGDGLVAVARDGLRMWRLPESGHRPHRLASADVDSPAVAAAFSEDGRKLAVSHADRTARLRTLTASGGGLKDASAEVAHGSGTEAVALSPDGGLLATGGGDAKVRLWETSRPRADPVDVLGGHTDTVNAVAFSPDGRTVAGGSTDATVRRWSVGGSGPARELPVFQGHTDAVDALAFSPDGRTLVTGGPEQPARLWDLPGPALTGHSSSVYSVAFSPGGRLLATGSYDRSVRLWSLADPRRPRGLPPLTGHKGPVNSVAFKPGGRVLASGSADGTVRMWGLTGSHRHRTLAVTPSRVGHVNSVAFSPDGRTLATGGESGTVRLWDATDARRPRALADLRGAGTGTGAVNSVAFTHDGRTLAVAGRHRAADLWDVGDRRHPRRLARLTGHSGAVKSVAFSPDGRTAATGSEDRTVRLWDVADRRRPVPRQRLGGYADGVMSVAFAPDGRTLATASSDNTVRLYDTTAAGDPAEPAVLAGHPKPVDALAFSPDGHTLATGAEDWTALLWDPGTRRVASRICDTASPPVTRAEWRQYFPQHDYRAPCGS